MMPLSSLPPSEMDEIHFYCTICGESLCALSENAGGLCDCPRCLRVIPIPGYPARPGPPADGAAVFSPDILEIEIKFLCGGCGNKIRVDARRQGQTLECPICEEPTRVPEWGGARPPAEPGAVAAKVRLSAEECEFLSAPMKNGGRTPAAAGGQ